MYFVITLLIVSSLIFAFNNHRFSYFTKDRTCLLKAFLPYLIFIHHSHFFDGDFYYIGAFVVSLFFFISGYGLESKRGQDAINYKHLPTALKKLLVPLIIPIVIYLFIRLFREPVEIIVEDILQYQIILPYTWFVVTLIILYVIFYSCAVIASRYESKVFLFLCFVIVTVLFFSLFGKYTGVPSWGRNTTTAFLAGIIYKNIENKMIGILGTSTKFYMIIISIILILVTIYIKGDILNDFMEGNFLKRPVLAFFWPLLFIPIYTIIPVLNNSAIRFLSSISYELYVCQSIGYLLLGDKFQYPAWLYLLIVFIGCTIIASLCKSLTCLVFKQQ